MPSFGNADVGGSGALSEPEAFEIVSRSVQEASHRHMQEVMHEALQALEVKMEERLNLLAQQMEERVGTLAQRMEEQVETLAENLGRLEGRVLALETTYSASAEGNGGPESVVKKLDVRVQQLEASVQKALEGVLPRVDSLLQQLERNCPPAPFAVPSTSSASHPPKTRQQDERPKMPSASTSSPQPCALVSVSSAARTSSASSSPKAPSPAVPSSTPSTANVLSLSSTSLKSIALGERLYKAVEEGRVGVVKKVLNEGANVNHRGMLNRTPLMAAAWNGHADVVSLLLKRGADVNAEDGLGCTALHCASRSDRSGCCMKLLIERRSQLHSKDRRGRTALHRSAQNNNEEAVWYLIAAGASNTVKDYDGNVPSDLTIDPVIRRVLLSSSQ